MSPAKVPGFDYKAGKQVALTPAQWRQEAAKRGLVRVVCNGETWYKRRSGGVELEVYKVVGA